MTSISVDTSGIPDPVYTSLSEDQLKSYIHVHGQFADGSQELSVDDYSLSIVGGSTSLQVGANTIVCTVVGNSSVTTSFIIEGVLQDTLDSLRVEGPTGNVYVSTDEDVLKGLITVYGYFASDPDNGVEIDPDNYRLNWSRTPNVNATVEVTVTYNNKVVTGTFNTPILDIDAGTISNVEFPSSIYSSNTLSDLLRVATITGTNNDGSPITKSYLEIRVFDIEGSELKSLSTGPDGTATTKVIQIWRTSDKGVGVPLYEKKIEVSPTNPSNIQVSLSDPYKEYMAFQSVVPGDLSVRVNFANNQYRDLESGEYTIQYIDKNGEVQDRDSFFYGDTHIRVTYKENGVSVQTDIVMVVNYAEVAPPYLEGVDRNYNGEPYEWHLTNYDSQLLNIVSITPGADYEIQPNNDSVTITATDKNTYTVKVGIADPNYAWSSGGTDVKEFTFQILAANSQISVEMTGDLTYGESYGASATVTGINDTVIEGAGIIYEYYGRSFDGETVWDQVTPSKDLPTEAGNWYVRATFQGGGNYTSATTGWQPFTIQKKVLEVPSATDRVYVLNTTQYSGISSLEGVYSVEDAGGMYVGSYKVSVTITDTNNYIWPTSTSSTERVEIEWSIEQRSIGRPTENTTSFTYDGTEQTYLPMFQEGTDTYLTVTGNKQTDAGYYTVTVSLSDPINTKWASGTGDSSFKWQIQRQQIQLPSVSGSPYTGSDVIAILSGYDNEIMTISAGTPGLTVDEGSGKISAIHAGQYTFSVKIKDGNYQWEGEGNPDERELTWTISLADNTLVSFRIDSWTYGDTASNPSAEFTFGNDGITYTYTEVGAGSAGSSSTPPQNAGTYWVWATVQETSDYAGCTEHIEFTISVATNTISGISIEDWTYGDEPNDPSLESVQMKFGSKSDIVITYTDSSSTTPGDVNTPPTEAGEYRVWAIIRATGNYTECSTYCDFTIDRQVIGVPGIEYPNGQTSVMYTGSPITVNAGAHETYSILDGSNIATDAGPHYMKVKPTDNYCWSDGTYGDMSVTWYIEKRTVTPSLTQRETQHTGSVINPTISLDEFATSLGVGYSAVWSNGNSTDVGYGYTIALTLEDSNNFTWVSDGERYYENGQLLAEDKVSNDGAMITLWYAITLTQYSLSIDLDQNRFTYTGSQPAFSIGSIIPTEVYESLPSDVKIALSNSGNYTLIITKEGATSTDGWDVGQYRLVLNISSVGTYASVSSAPVTFYITEASMTVSGFDSESDTYRGEPIPVLSEVPCVTTVNSQEYKIEYCYGNLEWSSVVPEFTDSGSYIVQYRVTAPNHADVNGEFTFTVDPKPVTVEVYPYTTTYTGSEPVLSAVRYDVTGLIEGDDLCISFESEGITAGFHDILGTWSNTNYEVKFTGLENALEISPADFIRVEVSGYRGEYDGENHPVQRTVDVDRVDGGSEYTITFSLSEDGEYSSSLSLKDVSTDEGGVYTVYYKVTADNHNDDTGTFEVSISKKELIVTADPTTVTYGNQPSPTVTYSGFVEGEDASVLGGELEFDLGSYTTTTDAGTPGLQVTPRGLTSGNYSIEFLPGTLTVQKRTIEVILQDYTIDYDHRLITSVPIDFATISSSTPTANGHNASDLFYVVVQGYSGGLPDVVGGYTFTIAPTELGERNYTMECASASYTITQTDVTINIDIPQNLTYDGSVKEAEGSVINHSDLVVQLSYEKNVDGVWTPIGSAPKDAGSYRVTATTESGNYKNTGSSVGFTIAKATYDITGVTIWNYNGVYDGKSHSAYITGNLPKGADGSSPTPVYSNSYIDVCDMQPVTVTFTTTSDNYDVSLMVYNRTVTITPYEAEVQWVEDDFTYNGQDRTVEVTASFIDVDGTTKNLVVDNRTDSDFKDYNSGGYVFEVTSQLGGNYTLSGAMKTFHIQQLKVSIEINDTTRQYGCSDPMFEWGYAEGSNEFVNGEIVPVLKTHSDERSNAGSTWTIWMENSTLQNYDLEVEDGTMTIVPRVIKLSIVQQTHVYDGRDPVVDSSQYSVTEGSVLGGDNIQVKLTKETGSDVGSYDISGVSLNSNYSVMFEKGEDAYKITPATMSVSTEGEYPNLAPSTWTFDDSSHPVVQRTPTAHTADTRYDSDVTFTYSLTGEDGSYSGEVPQLTHAGTYTVHYIASKDNHTDLHGTFTVIVCQADNAWLTEYSNSGWTFGKYEPNVVIPVSKFGSSTIQYSYYTDEGMTQEYTSEFGPDAAAVTYYVKVTVPETTDYKGLESPYSFTVERASYEVSWDYSEFTYDGQVHRNTLEYVSGRVSLTGYTEDGVVVDTSSGSISMTASSPGRYEATFKIEDRNYVFENGMDVLTVYWWISGTTNSWTVQPFISGWTYGEQPSQPSGSTRFGTVLFTYSNSINGPYTLTQPSNAGTYWMRAYVDGSDEYGALEASVSFTISKATEDKPYATVSTYTYDGGKDITLVLSGFDQSTMNVTGDVHQNVGTYMATVTLSDPNNYEWSDGSGVDAIEISWEIIKAEVSRPSDNDVNGMNSYTFSGDMITFVPEGLTSQMYIVGNVQRDANQDGGTYFATVYLVDSENYMWAETGNSDIIVIPWKIQRLTVDAPVFEPDEVEYDGTVKTAVANGFYETYMGVRTEASMFPSNGAITLSETNAGEYRLVFFLKDTVNYEWSEDARAEDGLVTYTWTISPATIGPLEGILMTYTGFEVTFIPEGFNPSVMEISGNTATDAGTYEAVVKLLDTVNYTWSDDSGVSADGSVTVEWSIVGGGYDLSGIDTLQTFEYDGQSHFPVIGEIPPGEADDSILDYKVSGDSVTDVGVYTFTVTFRTESMYYEAPEPITITVQIVPRAVTVVIDSVESVYGEPLTTLTATADGILSEDEGTVYKLSTDVTVDSEPGAYDIVGTVTNGNYAVTFVNQSDSYTVTKIQVDRPTNGVTGYGYTGHIVTYMPTFPQGFDRSLFTITGNTGVDVGHYTAYVSLRDTAHYTWSTDGQEVMEFGWDISSGGLNLNLDRQSAEYTGGDQYIPLNGYDPNVMSSEGVIGHSGGSYCLIVREIGEYTFRFSITQDGLFWADSMYIDEDGYAVLTFTVTKLTMKVPAPQNTVFYDGESHDAPFASDQRYSIGGVTSAVDAGTYTASFTLTDPDTYMWAGHGDETTVHVDWEILPYMNVSIADFSMDATATYTGEEIRLPVTSLIGLVEGEDYTVVYIGDLVNVGHVSVTITGTGNYNFEIEGMGYDIRSMTVQVPSEQEYVYDGQPHSYAGDGWHAESDPVQQTNVGVYEAHVVLLHNTGGHENTVWSDPDFDGKVIWRVVEADVVHEPPTASPIDHGSLLSDSVLTGGSVTGVNGVAIPGHFEWVDGDEVMTSSGFRTAVFVFDNTFDENNYVEVHAEVYVQVNTGGSSGPGPTDPPGSTDPDEPGTPGVPEEPDYADDVVFPTAGPITEGQALSDSVLTGGSTGGTFQWLDPGYQPPEGEHEYLMVFTPTDGRDYSRVSGWDPSTGTVQRYVEITVMQSGSDEDPTVVTDIEFPTAGPIVEGQMLSDSVLTGGSEGGIFQWMDPGYQPPEGEHEYLMVFTPTDGRDYSHVSGWDPSTGTVQRYVEITVMQSGSGSGDGPTVVTDIEFPTAGPIAEGQALSDSVLTGGSTGGTFQWLDPGYQPPEGEHEYLMVFTPTDGRDYSHVSGWDSSTGTVQRYVEITVEHAGLVDDSGFGFPWWVLMVVVALIIVGLVYRREEEEQ